MSEGTQQHGIGKAAEGVKETLLGKAKELTGRFQNDAELELEGKEQATKGRKLREAGTLEVKADAKDFEAASAKHREDTVRDA